MFEMQDKYVRTTLTLTDRTMRVNDENAQRAITVRKGQGGRGGGGGTNDGKQGPLPVFLSVLFPSQPDCGYAKLHI